ncbi:hypothetical protein MKW94_026952 [Papaver nudicaule]|uniref:DUF659 domain-containing protein n=1 Tax=Papaver nudicaule TaxID=74823 RepID=A0AA42AYB6_PAPNU|nr:hypothetical protein [Papaver nudicaule]
MYKQKQFVLLVAKKRSHLQGVLVFKGMHIVVFLMIKNKEMVDMKVAHCFIANNIPFNVIQTPTCIAMAKAISDYGVGYVLPSYSTLRGKLVPDSKTEVEAYIEKVKESWSVTGCTLMSDIWTDVKRKSFLNVVAYSPKGDVFLKSFERSDHRNTGVYIRDTLMSVIDEVGADNVTQIVADNASNYNLAGRLIMADHPHIIKTKCAAHGVQLLLEDYYKKVGWVKAIYNKAKSMYDYLYRHHTVLSLMRQYTGKDLREYSSTRFSSYFLMIQSILEVEDGLRNLVASPDWRGMQLSRTIEAVDVKDIIQGTKFLG